MLLVNFWGQIRPKIHGFPFTYAVEIVINLFDMTKHEMFF